MRMQTPVTKLQRGWPSTIQATQPHGDELRSGDNALPEPDLPKGKHSIWEVVKSHFLG